MKRSLALGLSLAALCAFATPALAYTNPAPRVIASENTSHTGTCSTPGLVSGKAFKIDTVAFKINDGGWPYVLMTDGTAMNLQEYLKGQYGNTLRCLSWDFYYKEVRVFSSP